MTAKELIQELKKVPPETEVLVSSDEEGNSFRAAYQLSAEAMIPAGRGNYEMDANEKAKQNYLVLWPA